jgi:hypothetical protein
MCWREEKHVERKIEGGVRGETEEEIGREEV